MISLYCTGQTKASWGVTSSGEASLVTLYKPVSGLF